MNTDKPTTESGHIDWRQHDDLCGLLTGFATTCDCAGPLPDDGAERATEFAQTCQGICDHCAPDAYHHCQRPEGHGGYCSCEVS